MRNELNEFQVVTMGSKLPEIARDTSLPGRYRTLYNQLLQQALAEFPPIEGYETTHVMLMERAVYFFCRQKFAEDSPTISEIDFKRYRQNFGSFIKSCEALLKEARSISAETTFKHNFVMQVVEVIDRCFIDSESKRTAIRELGKLATS